MNTGSGACYLEHAHFGDGLIAVLALDLHQPDWRHDGFSLQDVGTVAMNPGEHWDIAEDLGGVFPLQRCAYALHSCLQELVLTHLLHDWMNMHVVWAHCCSECNLSSFLVRNINA